MTNHAEDVLLYSLTDVDRLEQLVKVGLDEDAIPTTELRPVIAWAVEQYFRSSMTLAPSREALNSTWGKYLEEAKIELLPEDEDADTIEWAIEELKDTYVHFTVQEFVKTTSLRQAEAEPSQRFLAVAQSANELSQLVLKLQSRSNQVDGELGLKRSLADYQARVELGQATRGMTFSMGQVDDHTFGIHPGELAILAAPPKTGKSQFLNRVALEEARRGRTTVLFTLENSVEMTMDRIACFAAKVSSRSYQRGTCEPEEIERIQEFLDKEGDVVREHLHVIYPEESARTMTSMVQQAQVLGADSLLIDQLTFVNAPNKKVARHEQIRDMMHEAKVLISTGHKKLPLLLAHQVNREGEKAANKQGYLEMNMLAEGSEVERTSDWVFGLYQSSEERKLQLSTLQVLAARREDVNAWSLAWSPSQGIIQVIGEKELTE